MPKLTKSYQESLLQALQNPQEAAEYLTAALEDGDSAVFLLALRNVADAQGMRTVAHKAQLNRLGTGESSAWLADRAARCSQLTLSDHGEVSPPSAWSLPWLSFIMPLTTLGSKCCQPND